MTRIFCFVGTVPIPSEHACSGVFRVSVLEPSSAAYFPVSADVGRCDKIGPLGVRIRRGRAVRALLVRFQDGDVHPLHPFFRCGNRVG